MSRVGQICDYVVLRSKQSMHILYSRELYHIKVAVQACECMWAYYFGAAMTKMYTKLSTLPLCIRTNKHMGYVAIVCLAYTDTRACSHVHSTHM